MAKKLITVRVLDQNFTFGSDAPEERVKKITDFLNNSLKDVLSKSKGITPYSAAILTALNITEKYLALQEKQTAFKSKVSEKSKKILGLLEDTNNTRSSS